ncbi:MAG: TonB-dependent receptor [Vicinamibacteria bacterium]|nr:TonB-dependent receptor [Vicinamibacteria bacterium]
MKIRAMAVVLAALTLGTAPTLWAAPADGSGSVTVTVKDNYGVLPGTVVRLVGKDGQAAGRANADASGTAKFTSLAAGEYTVKASLSGFADAEKAGITVGSSDVAVELVMSLTRFSTNITVTTANRREELLMNTAEPTTVIDQVQILDTGARNAKDLLSEQQGSGVQVNVGGGQGYVSLNGVSNKGVLVMIDGRRYLGRDANGNFNLEDLPITGVERVEVVKGAGSAIYGSDAMGGVINFITAKGKNNGFKNTLNVSGGTYKDYRGDDSLTYRAEKGGFALNGGYRTYDGFDLEPVVCTLSTGDPATCPRRPPNPQTIGQPESQWQTFGGNADYRLSDKLTFNFVGDYSNRDMDKYFFSGATQLSTTVYNSQRKLQRYNLTPELNFTPGKNTTVNLSYLYGRYNRDETQLYTNRPSNPKVVVPRWTESNDEVKARLLQVWRMAGRENPFQVGFEHRKEQLSRSGLKGCVTGQACLKDRDLNVVWAQQEVAVTKDLKVTAGFRYDDSSDYGTQTSPKLAGVYSLPKNNRLRVSYGKGFRAPYFGELLLVSPGFEGNPDLKPEKSETITGGWAYTGPKFEASVDVYKAKIENGVNFGSLPNGNFTYVNVTKFDSKGTNAAFAVNLPYGFSPSVSYTYTKRVDPNGVDIGGFARHAAFVKLLWANQRYGLRANIRGNLSGKVPQTVGATSYTPAYNLWSAQASKKVTSKGKYAFTIYAQVNNMFDVKDIYNVNAQGQPVTTDVLPIWTAPRTYLAGITIDMDWTR